MQKIPVTGASDFVGALLHPDYVLYPEHERNLSMSVDKIFRALGGAICFSTTLNGLMLFDEYCK